MAEPAQYASADAITLPWDIICDIVDAVYQASDIATLRCCSLISSDLRHKCQALIFSRVTLKYRYSVFKFAIMLEMNPTLATYIKDLWLNIPRARALNYPTQFPYVLSHLRNVEKLTITSDSSETDWNIFDMHMKVSIEQLIVESEELQDLNLHFVALNIPLPYLLHRSYKLRHLSLNGPRDLNMDMYLDLEACSGGSDGRTTWPRLHSVSACGLSAGAVCELLESKAPDGRPIVDFQQLSSIILDTDYQMVGSVLITKLFPVLQNLDFLKLHVHQPMTFSSILKPYASSLPSTLHTLSLFTKATVDEMGDPLNGICEELSTIPRDNVLRCIQIGLHIYGNTNLKKEHWEPLGDIFTRTQFPYLTDISVTVSILVTSMEVGRKADFLYMAEQCFPGIRQEFKERFQFVVESVNL